MKKIVLVMIMVMICVYVAFGQSEINLDTAIQQASKTINDSLFVGVKVALLNCGSGSTDLSKYVIDKMTTALDNGRKLTLITGNDVDRLRSEMNLQLSSEINDTPALELGKKLGAAIVVTGSFVKNGNSYRYTVRTLDVNTKALQKSSSFIVKDDQQVRQLLGIKDVTPVTTTTATTAPSSARTSVATATYKIGDTGPAGGIIFYDKGNNNDGWRYLEAAPEEAEFRAIWSVHNTRVDTDLNRTRVEIGYGKKNTLFIVEIFKQTAGEWDTAAQRANDLVYKGFSDWFLPSKAELDQMYGNLKRKNLGDFKNEWYWSSTEDSSAYSCAQNFKDGKMDTYTKRGNNFYIRPIRQVAGQ